MSWGYFLDENDKDNYGTSNYDKPAAQLESLDNFIFASPKNNIPFIQDDENHIVQSSNITSYSSQFDEDFDNFSQNASSAPVLTDIESESFSTKLPKSTLYYKIQFHPNRVVSTKNFKTPSDYAVGDYVLTEADRGYDIGQIISISDDNPQPNFTEEEDFNSAPNQIIRKATPQEIFKLKQKQQREIEAKEICQQKANELELPMTITSTEFQFDGKKLTVYFSATQYIDFRNLVHSLFRIFGTRIWMVWFDGQAPVRDVFTHIETTKRKRHRNH